MGDGTVEVSTGNRLSRRGGRHLNGRGHGREGEGNGGLTIDNTVVTQQNDFGIAFPNDRLLQLRSLTFYFDLFYSNIILYSPLLR